MVRLRREARRRETTLTELTHEGIRAFLEKHVPKAELPELPFLGGDLILDAHTAILMREHGLKRIYTHDSDFHRFRFLEVVDPLARSEATRDT